MKQRVHDGLSLEYLSEHRIYTMTDASGFDYQWWQGRHCWRSFEAHFREGAWSVSLSFFPITAANTLIIYRNDHIAFDLPDIQDQKSLTLRWRSISERGREHDPRSFAYIASQYCIYDWSEPIAKQITNDARPEIVDAPLTFILPWAYPQYVIIYFCVIYHEWCFGSLCTVFIYFLLHQNIVLWNTY